MNAKADNSFKGKVYERTADNKTFVHYITV